jgi:hypothetical protein
MAFNIISVDGKAIVTVARTWKSRNLAASPKLYISIQLYGTLAESVTVIPVILPILERRLKMVGMSNLLVM